MMQSFEKDPNATLDYVVDWSKWLQQGETISTSTWTVPAGLTQPATPAASNTATTATVWLAGGSAGANYDVSNRITTSAGRTDDRTIRIIVRER